MKEKMEEYNLFKYFDELIKFSKLREGDSVGMQRLENDEEIYAEFENLYPLNLSLSTSSLVVNTSTTDCSLKCKSFDQMGILLNANDNARYSVSSLSGISELACLRNFSNNSFGTDVIFSFKFSQSIFNSLNDNLDNTFILDLCFSNSSIKYWGEYNSTDSEKIISLVTPVPINPVNKTVASMTNFNLIYCNSGYNSLYLLCIDDLTLFANSFAFISVNLDLETIFLNCSNVSLFFFCSINSSLAISDQLTHENSFNSDLIFSGIVSVTDGIYNSPLFFDSLNLFNSESLFNMPIFNSSFQLTSGNFFLASSNSSGNDKVIVAILVYSSNSVYNHKSVCIYKPFDFAENAGYGFDKMFNGWKAYYKIEPIVENEITFYKIEFPLKVKWNNVPDNVPDKRRADILELMLNNNKIITSEISLQLKVNEKTIRRDINRLKKEGKIKRMGPQTGGRGYWEVKNGKI